MGKPYADDVYELLDVLFVVFHTALIAFNLFGWIWKRTRRLHLLVIGATYLSWYGFGLFYGFGYCPCTDWHWDVKRALGEQDLPASYVKYYADAVTGMEWDAWLIDRIVLGCGFTAFVISIYLNVVRRPAVTPEAD